MTAEIGERERGEEELRFRNLILSTQQEVSIDGMLVVDVVGKIISSNRRFAEMWGIPPDIIESGSDERALQFVMDKLANPEEFIRKVKFLYANAGEKSKEEVSLKDGRTFDRYSAPLLGAGGEYLGRVWYFSDVTEHKQALEGLRFSNARLQALWSVSSGDHADSEMVANEIITAIVQMTGSEYGFYDLVGMDESVLTIQGLFGEAMAGCSVADKRKQYRIDQVGVWAEAVRRRAPFIMNDYSAPHAGKKGLPEGHVPIKRILVVPHFSSGKITAVAAVANKAIDYTEDDARQMTAFLAGIQVISDRKRAEEERKKLEDQLRVAQKMEAIGSLAGGVAHDFNNMLGVILGHADLALMTLGPDQPLSGALREIRSAAERSANLTRQLLAFARKQTVAPRVLDLNEAMEGMLKMLRRLIGEDVELSWLPGAGLWPVRVDPSQIDQVMANLCVNARDAIDGVGRIGIETGNAVLDAGYCAAHRGAVPGEYVRITVSDSGCGMDGNVKEHLFEPFFTTKEKSKGTGLGLATVYGIVKQNNGYISIDSEPGRGSTFSIYLPRHVGKVEPVPAQDPAEPALRGRETILLVEDEPANLKLTREMLERQGYTALPAGTPGEADRIAAEHAGEIHLLVTDVVLPGMNGRELARKLQSLHPHLKCLFISGYTADIIVHQGVLDEGIHFLAKPFTAAVLARKVREVLDDGAGLAEGQEKAV